MVDLMEFIEQAEAQPTIQTDRPSEPQPLAAIQQRLVKHDGSFEESIVLVEDEDDYPMTKAWAKCDPDDVEDLAGWR